MNRRAILALGSSCTLLTGCADLALMREQVLSGTEFPTELERQIHPGMTEADVEAILGRPAKHSSNGRNASATYREIRQLRACRLVLGPIPFGPSGKRVSTLELRYLDGNLVAAWLAVREGGKSTRRDLLSESLTSAAGRLTNRLSGRASIASSRFAR
jgi:hypothetical protein